jgi:hypothetical protein
MPIRSACLVVILTSAACLTGNEPYADHDEASDLDPVDWGGDAKADVVGIPGWFDRNLVVTDALFTATDAVDGDAIQRFFETSPYHNRSWLADEMIDGQRVSDLIVSHARAHAVNPVLLLARIQVEASLVSQTRRPSQWRIDSALGCGCPDGSACGGQYRGFEPQLECGAMILEQWFEASEAGKARWRVGHTTASQDDQYVSPKSNGTAAMYSYTPWVLQGRGGNWLVWNVTRKYLKAFDEAGALVLTR